MTGRRRQSNGADEARPAMPDEAGCESGGAQSQPGGDFLTPCTTPPQQQRSAARAAPARPPRYMYGFCLNLERRSGYPTTMDRALQKWDLGGRSTTSYHRRPRLPPLYQLIRCDEEER